MPGAFGRWPLPTIVVVETSDWGDQSAWELRETSRVMQIVGDVLRQLCLQLFDPLRDIAGLRVNIG
jgi:hypothetical protein